MKTLAETLSCTGLNLTLPKILFTAEKADKAFSFICVHLRSSVDHAFCISLSQCRHKTVFTLQY